MWIFKYTYLLCDFKIRFISEGVRELIFYLEVPNKLICLKLTLPLSKMFLESSSGGVWNSNGLAKWHFPILKKTWESKKVLQIFQIGFPKEKSQFLTTMVKVIWEVPQFGIIFVGIYENRWLFLARVTGIPTFWVPFQGFKKCTENKPFHFLSSLHLYLFIFFGGGGGGGKGTNKLWIAHYQEA